VIILLYFDLRDRQLLFTNVEDTTGPCRNYDLAR